MAENTVKKHFYISLIGIFVILALSLTGCGSNSPAASGGGTGGGGGAANPPPVLASIAPASGTAGSATTYGTTLIVNGSNLGTYGNGWPKVTINGVQATVWGCTGTQLIVNIPATGMTGALPLVVATPAGSSSAMSVTVSGTATTNPSVSSISPTLAMQGARITITGTNFDTLNTTVFITDGLWNSTTKTVPAPIVSITTTKIIVTIPAGLNLGSNSIIVSTVSSGSTVFGPGSLVIN